MTEKYRYVTKRQRAILSLLAVHGEMSTRAIIDDLYPDEKVDYESATYRSVTRTLRTMRNKGMIIKVAAQTLWKKAI